MSRNPTAAKGARRHAPLEDDLVATGHLSTKAPKRKAGKGDEDSEDKFVDAKASRKILKIGQELADEEEERAQASRITTSTTNAAFNFESRFDDDEPDLRGETYDDDGEEAWGDADEEVVEEVDLAPEDLDTFKKFFPAGDEDPLLRTGGIWGKEGEDQEDEGPGTNLADLILEKIAAHEAQQAAQGKNVRFEGVGFGESAQREEDEFQMPPKVVEVYSKIGLLLSRYKSGKLPKPFKILPSVPHWETIIQLTRPESWSPNACYEATRIFISAPPHVAQRFLEMVILDRVRDEIHETKKLNVHLFNALKKSLYKPAAFFKGVLFPLVSSGTCTLREAHIISGVLTRVSVPVLHSAAAIKGLCDIAAQEASAGSEGGGATNIFIRCLLEKKYALPYQVVDALVFHFMRFRTVDPATLKAPGDGDVQMTERQATNTKLPVIWHQCLLSFAQRYRNDVTEDQREALLDLLLTHGHAQIGPEVRRELLAGRGRGVLLEPEGPGMGGDDTMMMD